MVPDLEVCLSVFGNDFSSNSQESLQSLFSQIGCEPNWIVLQFVGFRKIQVLVKEYRINEWTYLILGLSHVFIIIKKTYIEKPQMIDPHKGGPSFTPRFCVSSEFWLVEVETVAGRGSAGPGCDSVPVARRLPRWRHRPLFSKGGF